MSLKRPRLKSSLPTRATLAPRLPRSKIESLDAVGQEAATGEPRPIHAATVDGARLTGDTATRTSTTKRRLQRRVTPLEVLQEPLQAGIRKVFDLRRFLVVLGLTAVVLLLPTPPGLSEAGHRALALFVFTGSILALEPAPLPIAALMVPIAQIALGIDTASGAFAPFGQPVLFLILGSLFLAEALNKHGLIRRMALFTIVYSQGRLHMLTLGLILVSGMLSMWVLNTATVAVLIPVAITVAQRVEPQQEAAKVLSILLLTIAFSSSVGGMGTIMGSGENAIAAGLLDQLDEFGFMDWLVYGLPITLCLLALTWVLLRWLFPMPHVSINTEPAMREMERLGGLKAQEREILLVLGFSMLFWIAGATIEGLLDLPATLLSSAVVAIGAVAILSIEEIVDWNDLRSVNWGVFFVIGAGLTLGDAMAKTGASEWFAGLLAPSLEGLPYGLILAILVAIAFVLTQLINNVPLGAIFAPVLITLGEATGIDPVRLVIPTIITVGLAYMLPGASARMTLVAVTGAVDRKEMVRVGLLVGLPSALFVLGFFYLLSLAGLI
jgi:sodium-dependent dicarboxylate transporter 2/3/5